MQFLTKLGYKEVEVPEFEKSLIKDMWQKQVPAKTTKCDTNDVKMSFFIKHYYVPLKDPENHIYDQYKIEIVAEKLGLWWELSSYGLLPDDLKKNIQLIESRLLRAWEAIAR
jgi:hypothetical protein